jgi:hypothetical protein
MITFLYETIPASSAEQPKHYEIPQAPGDAPLTVHPQTGEKIKRVILGGFGAPAPQKQNNGGCGCGPSGCC